MRKEEEMPAGYTWMQMYFLQELTVHVQGRRGCAYLDDAGADGLHTFSRS